MVSSAGIDILVPMTTRKSSPAPHNWIPPEDISQAIRIPKGSSILALMRMKPESNLRLADVELTGCQPRRTQARKLSQSIRLGWTVSRIEPATLRPMDLVKRRWIPLGEG